jgi:hypothetical protein
MHYLNGTIYADTFHTAFLSDADLYHSLYERLELGQTFGLGFNYTTGKWYLMSSEEMATDPLMYEGVFPQYSYDPNQLNGGSNSWLIYCEFGPEFWRLHCRGIGYVFESEKTCKFFFVNEYSSIDPQTGKAGTDAITLLKKPNGLPSNLMFALERPYIYSDGYQEPNRVRVRFYDSNQDGEYDHPNSYYVLEANQGIIVHQIVFSTDGYASRKLIRELNSRQEFPLKPNEYGYVVENGLAVILKGQENNINTPLFSGNSEIMFSPQTGQIQQAGNQQFVVGFGANQLVFQWKHFAPTNHRIDPAVSNIIDIFVLTNDYNDSMLAWRNAGADPKSMPKPPSELKLRQTFGELNEFKMFSDEMIWRPVKFKTLFGPSADPELRAKLKVVKLDGSTMSDGEIKSQVVESVKNFFNVNMWEFGETFFFSELGAYIHRQLSAAISSVEIVPTSGKFGQLREIRCLPDELFFAALQVQDVEIITANTPTNLRIS